MGSSDLGLTLNMTLIECLLQSPEQDGYKYFLFIFLMFCTMLCIRDTGGLAAGDWSWLRVITLTWRHHIDGSYLTRSNTVYLVGLSEKFRESKLGEWSLGT